MSRGWSEFGAITIDAVKRCERIRLRRAIRLADQTMSFAGGVACRRRGCAWLNVCSGAGLSGEVTAEEVGALCAWYDQLGMPGRVELADRVGESIYAMLGAAGFRLKWLVSVMSLELQPGSGEETSRPGLDIRRLSDADPGECERVARVLAQSFAPAGTQAQPVDIEANIAGLSHSEAMSYGAFVDGLCVGGAVLDVHDGLGCLWGAAVEPAFRGRGVQTALIARRVRDAQAAGARRALIECGAGGRTFRNAARLGFVQEYTRAVLSRG